MPSTRSGEGPSDEQLARLVLRVLAAVVALTLAGGVAAAADRVNQRESPSRQPVAATPTFTPTEGGIGPLAGTAVTSYVDARRRSLATAKGNRAAAVSFATYLSADAAGTTAAAAGPVEVRYLLVALPGGRPTHVAGAADVAELIKAQRSEAAAEKKALTELLPTVNDPEFKRQYQEDLDRITALLAAPADVSDVVYGAVVVASADRLRALAAVPGVRLVDVGPGAIAPNPGLSFALRPEETKTAGAPPTRPH